MGHQLLSNGGVVTVVFRGWITFR